jgi:hypothetical protein
MGATFRLPNKTQKPSPPPEVLDQGQSQTRTCKFIPAHANETEVHQTSDRVKQHVDSITLGMQGSVKMSIGSIQDILSDEPSSSIRSPENRLRAGPGAKSTPPMSEGGTPAEALESAQSGNVLAAIRIGSIGKYWLQPVQSLA